MRIVHLAFLVIVEDLVGLRGGFEFGFGGFSFIGCDFVGMMC